MTPRFWTPTREGELTQIEVQTIILLVPQDNPSRWIRYLWIWGKVGRVPGTFNDSAGGFNQVEHTSSHHVTDSTWPTVQTVFAFGVMILGITISLRDRGEARTGDRSARPMKAVRMLVTVLKNMSVERDG